MSDAELRNMIMNFRVSDLQVLLGFAGRNKTGKKNELQARALDLLKLKSSAVYMKVRELHGRRYHHHQFPNVGSYLQDGSVNEPPPLLEDMHVNNYGVHCNASARPTPAHQAPSSSYSSGKSYLPSLPSNNSLPLYNSYPSVRFKEMPFYDILYVLVNPSSLSSDQNDRFQEASFYFTLTPEQAQNVSLSRTANGSYECQILLRFCLMDPSIEQEDNFPPSVSVKVNSKIVTLPNPVPTNRPGVEPKRPSKPVNITSFSKLSPTVTNIVTVSWTSTYGRLYAVGLFIARQLSAYTLLQRLKLKGMRNPDHTTAMIKEKLQQGQDADIATTSLRGSLLCPLGKVKMDLPCRAHTCTHLQCFDALLYLQMNEKKPKWICPVCDKPALYKNLAIDGLFIEIASKVPSECIEVQFHEDGSWTHIVPVKKEAKKAVEKNAKKKSVEVVDILSDSGSEEDDDWAFNPDSQTSKTADSPSSPSSLYYSSSQSFSTSTNPLGSFTESFRMPLESRNAVEAECAIDADAQLTSTSVSSSSVNSASFQNIQFLNDSSMFFNTSEQPVNGNQGNQPYNFDFLSLLQDGELSKHRDFDDKETPDVISLD